MSLVAVIGGRGFLGTALLRRLREVGLASRCLDLVTSGGQDGCFHADVTALPTIEKALAGASAIINLAAVHRDDIRPRSLYDHVNVEGARNVCEAARRNGIKRMVFTSSVAVYGFAPPNTDETGAHNYFNDYGRTKSEAEAVYREWAAEDSQRALTIVRPTVIFGERNRGNVYNLLSQIARGRFVMIGNGENVKSMAYVQNVAAFLVHTLSFGSGQHVYNYVDKPDMSMNEVVGIADRALGRRVATRTHLPYWMGRVAGAMFDVFAWMTRRQLPISSIRVKKFCSNTQFAASRISETGFVPPVPLQQALKKTIRYEFIENHTSERIFLSE